MGQTEVIEILKNSKSPLSSLEISQVLKEGHTKICKILCALEKFNEVEYFVLDRRLSMKFFKSKRKMKLYYLS